MEIVGIVGTYKSLFSFNNLVKDIKIRDINKALKIVKLDNSVLDKSMDELTMSELLKVELASKLDNDTIVIGGFSKYLNYKDSEYIKKLLKRLNKEFDKRIVVIDNNVNSFIDLVDKIYITKNNKIIYEVDDFYNDRLYDFVNMPKIIDFIKYVNKDKKILDNNTDIHELIKNIYRSI